jgi:hypothetical protein
MGRGLDGFLLIPATLARCAVLRARETPGLAGFRWLQREGDTSSHSEQSS